MTPDDMMPSDSEQRTRLQGKSGTPRVERRSIIRIAGEKLKEYADKLNANARRMKEFLKNRK